MAKLSDFGAQRQNLNKHTPRGMGLLQQSIQRDGWAGAITVAADGETFDGSARLEVAGAAGFEDAIVIESDGTRPIIHRRIDIPNADDLRAKRLGLAANRVAQVNLAWNAEEMGALLRDCPTLTNDLFTDEELMAIANQAGMAGLTPDKQPKPITCPHCGAEFTLGGK